MLIRTGCVGGGLIKIPNQPDGGMIPLPNLDVAIRDAGGQDVGEGETPVAFTGGDVVAIGAQSLKIQFNFSRTNVNAAGATYQVFIDGAPVGPVFPAGGLGPSTVSGLVIASVGSNNHTVGVRANSPFVETIISGQLVVEGRNVT